MSAEYRIDYTVSRRQDGDDDFADRGERHCERYVATWLRDGSDVRWFEARDILSPGRYVGGGA